MDTDSIIAFCMSFAAIAYAISVMAQVNEATRKIKILEEEIILLKKVIYRDK